MTTVTFIRHGPTAWNREGRIQGRRDVPLDEAGRQVVAAWRLPPELLGVDWYVSPLSRARTTAAALGIEPSRMEPRLAEMDWGEWEGERLEWLRSRLGERFAGEEARGLDFRPPGGESPRMLQQRVQGWLEEIARNGRTSAAVTHKGVIRAVYALAAGWDMSGPSPDRLRWHCAHAFHLGTNARVTIARLNIELAASRARAGSGP